MAACALVVAALAGCDASSPGPAPTSTGAPSAAAAPTTAACEISYVVTSQWADGFTANVNVLNPGPVLAGWTVTWEFSAGQRVTELWDGMVAQAGSAVTVTNMPYNADVGAGQTISFGFTGTWAGSNPQPDDFRVNETACSAAGTEPVAGAGSTPSTDPDSDPATAVEFFTDPQTQAYQAYDASTGETRAIVGKIATTPTAHWVGSWLSPSQASTDVRDYTTRAGAAGSAGVLVVYAIPGRDCGAYSAGGVSTSEYAQWIDQAAAGIEGQPWVILEPDALAQLGDCAGQGDRVGYLQYAARSLTAAGARVYLDIGHDAWLSVDDAVARLSQVGFADAAGFALNTSNFHATADEQAYGEAISARLGGRPYVIDTSRNGNGSNGEWCNPPGRALGARPDLVQDATGLDAFLWVKPPGESDGTCNGGPPAGQWWQDGALELARNAHW